MPSDPDAPESNVYHPPQPVSRRMAEPILYLADLMSRADNTAVPRELRAIDAIAIAAGLAGFRHQPWFREMNEASALQRLNTDHAKRAALVVLSLVLKADLARLPNEKAFFTHIREALGAEAITVPVDLEEHKRLALEYFEDASAGRPGRR
jgi:hypothetical protein